MNETILITGASGPVGRPLVDILRAEGADLRAVTRDPDAARLPAGVQHPATQEVAEILGRPARTYADWVADRAAAFRA